MAEIISILIVGALISAVYALIAIGFSLIFGVGSVLNLAHGALLMVGAYVFLYTSEDVTPVGGLLLAILATALVSYLIYRGAVRYIEHNMVTTFLVTLTIALILEELAIIQFSSEPASLEPIVSGATVVLGNRVTYNQIFGFVVSWASLGAVWYYVTRTQRGRATLALAMSEKGAKYTGVNIGRVRAETWLLAGGLAGLGGVFLGATIETSPTMWLDPLVIAFIIVVVGGLGSIKGSIVGAYLIGYLETIAVELGGPQFRSITALIVLVVIMLYRPQGLFGRELIEESGE
ncbi:branched-chain amino acid ABC transporter permease [Natrinema caseinilyticum]|uniref:branched-chain amino acid ABC transporter permease n=1 Tax=Natrinema caseinilyticum TaxID=2961570 RepID=UPI0030F476A8